MRNNVVSQHFLIVRILVESITAIFCEALLRIARHAGLAKLVSARLDRQLPDPDKVAATTITTRPKTKFQRLFAPLSHLESSMFAAAAGSLVARRDGPLRLLHTLSSSSSNMSPSSLPCALPLSTICRTRLTASAPAASLHSSWALSARYLACR